MKKILSFVLVLAMILGSVSMAFAKTELIDDVQGLECEEAVNVLTGLGVIEGYEDGSFRPERTISRAEAVKIIISALGIPVSENGNYTTPFADVAPTKWYAGYVQYAYTLGITEGTSATTFSPDAKVTYDQMIAFTLRALGYNEECLQGTYPACYINKAVGLDLLKKGVLTGSDAAPRAAVAQLIYNAVDAEIGKVDKDGTWVGNSTATQKDTFLDRLGAVSEDEYVVVTQDLINDEDTLVDLSDLLGAVVKLYVTNDKDAKYVAVEEVLTTFVTGKLKDGKIEGYKLATGVENTSVAGIGSKQFVFNNGEVNTSGAAVVTAGAFEKEGTFAVTFKAGKIDKVYTAQTWTINKVVVTSNADLKDLNNEVPTIKGSEFPMDEDKKNVEYGKFILKGVNTLDEIKKDDVLYVYTKADGTVAKLEVSSDKVEGKLTKISLKNDGSGNPDKYTVDGKAYSVQDNADASLRSELVDANIGEEFTLLLGFDGKIVKATTEATTSDYAVYLKAYNASDLGTISSSKENAGVGLFTVNGELKLYVDDEKISSVGALGLSAGALVKYEVNGDNEVVELTEVTNGAFGKVSAKGVFKAGIFNENSVVFNFSGDATSATALAKAKNYSVVPYTNLLDKDITASAVYAKDGYVKNAIVTAANAGKDEFFVVTGVAKVEDNDEVSVLLNGEATTLTAKRGTFTYTKPAEDALATVAAFSAEYDAKGVVTSKTACTETVDVKLSTNTALKLDGTILFGADDKTYELTDDAVVYMYDFSDKAWTVKTISALEGIKAVDGTIANRAYYVTVYDVNTDPSKTEYGVVVVIRK